MEFTATLLHFNNALWGYHFLVAEENARPFIVGNDRRIICKVNGRMQIHSALMPSKGGWFVLLNKKICDELGVMVGDRLHIQLEKDTSPYGMPMPEELQVLLDQDEVGSTYFHRLTPGKQRSLMYIVSKVKSMDSRLNKALAIVHHLKEAEGQLDFRRLNDWIKHYNNLHKMG